MKGRGLRLTLSVLTAIAVTGCDDDGPGRYLGVVSSAGIDAGAVVIELMGSGILEVEPVGSTRAFGAQGPSPDLFRVVLVAPVAGDLRFSLAVADRAAGPPVARVVEASDGGNENMAVSLLTVRFEDR